MTEEEKAQRVADKIDSEGFDYALRKPSKRASKTSEQNSTSSSGEPMPITTPDTRCAVCDRLLTLDEKGFHEILPDSEHPAPLCTICYQMALDAADVDPRFVPAEEFVCELVELLRQCRAALGQRLCLRSSPILEPNEDPRVLVPRIESALRTVDSFYPFASFRPVVMEIPNEDSQAERGTGLDNPQS